MCFCYVHDSFQGPRDGLYGRLKLYEHEPTLRKHQARITQLLLAILEKLVHVNHDLLEKNVYESFVEAYFMTQADLRNTEPYADALVNKYVIACTFATDEVNELQELLQDHRVLREGKRSVSTELQLDWIYETITRLRMVLPMIHEEHTQPQKTCAKVRKPHPTTPRSSKHNTSFTIRIAV